MELNTLSPASEYFSLSRSMPFRIGIVLLCLSGCDRTSDSWAGIERKSGLSQGAEAARQRISEGLKCVQLLGAIATASKGPLRGEIEKYDLDSIGPELASRWEARIRYDARDAGMTAEEVDGVLRTAPPVVLDNAELRNSADDAFACASDVSGSHSG
jgi:hypothetical protein